MSVITNSSAQAANRILNQASEMLSNSQKKISTGLRINSAADDAAGLAISNRLSSSINAKAQGERNVYDGISLARVYEQSLQGINENLGQLQSLAVAAGNGIYSAEDRAALQSQADAYISNARQIIDNSEFAGKKLFSADASVAFETGAGAINLSTTDVAAGLQNTNVFSIDLRNSTGVQAAVENINKAQQFIGELQTQAGAEINRFASAARNLGSQQIAESDARSRIADLDFAKAVSESTLTQIREQSARAIAVQANASSDTASKLLGVS